MLSSFFYQNESSEHADAALALQTLAEGGSDAIPMSTEVQRSIMEMITGRHVPPTALQAADLNAQGADPMSDFLLPSTHNSQLLTLLRHDYGSNKSSEKQEGVRHGWPVGKGVRGGEAWDD